MANRSRTLLTLLAGAALGAGATLGYAALAGRSAPSIPWQQASLFAEVFERVRRDYIEAIPDDRLMDSAVRGIVAGLDPFSGYLDAKEYEEMRANTSGAYSGIGIEVSTEGGVLKVVVAMEDAPAFRAGIRGGDIVVAIDGIPVDSARVNESVERMRGTPGSHVKLTISRAAEPRALEFDLIRRKVQVHSVHTELLEPGFAYARITQFSETTADDFASALGQMQKQSELRGLVMDLRNNPGGVLEAAVAVADDFLETGVIVTAEGRSADSRFVMEAQPGDLLRGAPIVILVNGGSASASEIVAGALKDQHRALLIGQTTYGKGSVQTVTALEQGGALKLTTSRYHTPSGATIHQRGIAPDIPISGAADNEHSSASGARAGPRPAKDDTEVRIALSKLRELAADKSRRAGAASSGA